MPQFISMIALTAIAATVISTIVMVNASVPLYERYYTTYDSCDIDAPAGDSKPYYPCFSCMNIPSSKAPSTLTTGTPTIITATPTTSPTSNLYPMQSIYTHCFVDKNEVYSIYYEGKDCEGKVTLDNINDDTCPDCTGCASTSDCGTSSSCPAKCCGFALECVRCQNAGMCNLLPDECDECPGCSNPNPYCDQVCTDSKMCGAYGAMCSGCAGCSNPPDPCASCVNDLYCSYAYRDDFCNKGNCSRCAKVDPCSSCAYSSICTAYPSYCNNGTCSICHGSSDPIESGDDSLSGERSVGRMLKEVENLKAALAPKIVLPEIEYFSHERILDAGSSNNFTSYAQSMAPVQDVSYEFAPASLYTSPVCSKDSFVGSMTLKINSCQAIPPEVDGQTLAIKFSCSFGSAVQVTVNGYNSTQDCENDSMNTTFSTTALDGTCVSAPSDKWGVTVQCAGWGKVPPTPAPVAPGSSDVTFGARIRYPDRRCAPGTGEMVGGGIIPCNVCTAFPNQDYKKYNCTTGEVRTYTNPDCSGSVTSGLAEKCDGLGPIRGIFNFEKLYKPVSSVAFFSAHAGSNGCWAENVELFAGVEVGVCTEIKPPKGSQSSVSSYVKVNCNTHSANIYATAGCIGTAVASVPFTDNSCVTIPGELGMLRASCSGYQTPQPTPPTKNPTTKTPTAPTAPTTPKPSTSPTLKTSATDNPSSDAISNIQVNHIVQALVALLVAMIAYQ